MTEKTSAHLVRVTQTIAPGVRLGWFTCNPIFAERLLRRGESTTRAPCGLGQALVAQLLITWKPDGYIRWLQGLGQQYTDCCDHFINLLNAKFHICPSESEHSCWKGCTVYDAYPKTGDFNKKCGTFGQARYFSFVAPSVRERGTGGDSPVRPRGNPQPQGVLLSIYFNAY